MNNNFQLTDGAVSAMLEGRNDFHPTIQIVEIKKKQSNTGIRYALALSDGKQYVQGTSTTQLNALVENGSIVKNCVVSMDNFTVNNIQGKKLVIVQKVTVLNKPSQTIGNPTSAIKQIAGQNVTQTINNNNNTPLQQQQQPPPPPSQGGFLNNRTPRQLPFQNKTTNNQNMGNAGGSNDNNEFQPISSLNPYQPNWRIKARCTAKGAMKHYKNQRGDGKLFSVDLLDKFGGEIQATMFNDAAEKFFPIFHVEGVYYVSRGQVKMARKQFTHIKNDYTLTLNADAVITPVTQEDQEISKQKFNFKKIGQLQECEANSFVDIIGIVKEVSPKTDIMSQKTQKNLTKRTIVLVDETAQIEVTLWNDQALEFDENKLSNQCIVALKAARVTDYGGKSLTAGNGIITYPDVQEANILQNLISKTQGDFSNIQKLTIQGAGPGGNATKQCTLNEAQQQQLGMNSEKGEYFQTFAFITNISRRVESPPWYKAAPEKDVNAKVTEDGKGGWFCVKNNKTYDNYEPRYILRFQISDFSGAQWQSAFNDCAEKILGQSAKETEQLLNSGDMEGFDRVFQAAMHKRFHFKIRAKQDTYQDERRIRYDCIDATPPNWQQYSQQLIESIHKLMPQKTQNNNNNNAFNDENFDNSNITYN